ncbi:MAG: 8-amino-7-oxononanoate synthase [Phycisphaerales bacterium]|nr:8-amino-7-oxononanoate synthase [Phycisphaerales bacterium]MBT7170301.1 8-amino-7-oxononanoate synthase [Phycisphaerales bacterium]
MWDDMQTELVSLAERDLLRDPRVVDSPCASHVTVDGREVVCLCSNDYLALANDPAVVSAAAEGVRQWGFGSGASRLVCGTLRPHRLLEEELAAFKHADDAMLCSTGWMANRIAILSLASAGDLILSDKLNHASILDATRASGARVRSYSHCDMDRLEALLTKHRADHRRCLIVTDSVFSMDGDVAPLAEIVALKNRFDATLMIDDAHGTGVLGAQGRGAAEGAGVESGIDVTVGTLSKALGCIGGFIASRQAHVDLLRSTARAYIYTTALPPAVAEAARAALRLVQAEPERRQRVLAMADDLRMQLGAAGLETLNSTTQILPVVVGEAGDAVRLSQQLFDAGFFAAAIRPPTVGPNSSRLRISLSSGHTEDEIRRFGDTLIALVGQ